LVTLVDIAIVEFVLICEQIELLLTKTCRVNEVFLKMQMILW